MVLLRRIRAAGNHWPWSRTAVFAVGVLALLVTTAGPVGVYARVLFWMFVVQVLLLLLIVPVLLAFGRPLTLLAEARRPGGPSWLRHLAHPLVGPALVPVCTGLVFFTGLLSASLQSPVVGAAVRLGLLLAGFVFALPLAGEGATPVSLAMAAALFIGFLELLADAVPGIAMRLRGDLLTDWYARLHRPWGPTPLDDQHLGGSILWVVAEVIDLPFLALLVVQWIRADVREAAAIDRQLDEQAAAAAPTAAPQAAAELAVPWWERDASVFGARSGQFRRPPRD